MLQKNKGYCNKKLHYLVLDEKESLQETCKLNHNLKDCSIGKHLDSKCLITLYSIGKT